MINQQHCICLVKFSKARPIRPALKGLLLIAQFNFQRSEGVTATENLFFKAFSLELGDKKTQLLNHSNPAIRFTFPPRRSAYFNRLIVSPSLSIAKGQREYQAADILQGFFYFFCVC
jgi:hypothetical protein